MYQKYFFLQDVKDINTFGNTNLYYIASLNSVISDIENTITEGLEWGSNVGIAFTATLLAISLLAYLFNRNT